MVIFFLFFLSGGDWPLKVRTLPIWLYEIPHVDALCCQVHVGPVNEELRDLSLAPPPRHFSPSFPLNCCFFYQTNIKNKMNCSRKSCRPFQRPFNSELDPLTSKKTLCVIVVSAGMSSALTRYSKLSYLLFFFNVTIRQRDPSCLSISQLDSSSSTLRTYKTHKNPQWKFRGN